MSIYRGKVTKDIFGQGSKSEHKAIYLDTEDGQHLVLRRVGGNPFADQILEDMVGKTISVEGEKHNYVLLFKDWNEE